MSVIKVNNVHKKFKVYYDKGQTFKEKLLFKNRNYYEDRWVLNGISFEVEKGEAIGLIGENGSGKSTLLKLMTKIMYPDEGSIEIEGRVSSLIELGAGFHPDMSGRENIYTNAAIFGLTKKEIDLRLKDIIEFSELEEFIDNPVRTYSSGMYMRLAFSVAINVDADVLLIDEILAVGDASFQAKCFSKLREIKSKGTTIVIVSHSLGQIEQICDRSIWIKDGINEIEGLPRDVHPIYMEFMGKKRHKSEEKDETEIDNQNLQENCVIEKSDISEGSNNNRWGSKYVEITNVILFDTDGKEKDVYKTGETMHIVIEYKVNKAVDNVVFGIGVFRNDGVHCYGTNTSIDRIENINLKKIGNIECIVNDINLLAGEYSLDIAFHADDGFAFDYYRDAKRFRIYSNIADIGITRLKHSWIIDGENKSRNN